MEMTTFKSRLALFKHILYNEQTNKQTNKTSVNFTLRIYFTHVYFDNFAKFIRPDECMNAAIYLIMKLNF